MAEEPRAGSWWKTLPGVLTAVAGLITAVTGLIVALHQILPGSSSHTTPPPPITSVSAPAADTGSQQPPATASAAAYRVAFPSGTVARPGARYDVLRGRVERYNPDQLALKLTVRMTNDGAYPANFWDNSFRLSFGGATHAPIDGLDDVVESRSSDVGTIVFVVPASARRLTLLVGEQNTVRLPVVLRPR
jgi:hypothetical protein